MRKHTPCWGCQDGEATYRDRDGLPFCSRDCEASYREWLREG